MIIIVTGSVGSGKTYVSRRLSSVLGMIYLDINRMIKTNKIYDRYDKKYGAYIVDTKRFNEYMAKYIKKVLNARLNKISRQENLANKKDLKSYFGVNKAYSIKKFNERLIKFKKRIKNKKLDGLIIDSHLSHNLSKKYVDLCIVTKCDIKKLYKRLRKRGYPNRKIRENLDAEIFDVCFEEAIHKRYKPLIIDTS